MVRAFSTLGCVEASLNEVADLAQSSGLAVEVRGLAGQLDLPECLEKGYGDPARWAEAARAVRIIALDTSFRLIDGTAADQAALLAYVPWAEALGGVRLRVFDGGTTLTEPELAAAVERLQWWQEQLQRHGWRSDLMIETHDALVTTERIQRLMAAAPAGTGLLWDAHHTWMKGNEDPVATWEALRPHIVHVHVKDSLRRPSEHHPFTYVLPGDGAFPMAALRAALERDHFDGVLSLEWERQWHPYLAPVREALLAAERRRWW